MEAPVDRVVRAVCWRGFAPGIMLVITPAAAAAVAAAVAAAAATFDRIPPTVRAVVRAVVRGAVRVVDTTIPVARRTAFGSTRGISKGPHRVHSLPRLLI